MLFKSIVEYVKNVKKRNACEKKIIFGILLHVVVKLENI